MLTTYGAEFIRGIVLKMLEEVTSRLVLFQGQLNSFGFARVLLDTTAARTAPGCKQNISVSFAMSEYERDEEALLEAAPLDR